MTDINEASPKIRKKSCKNPSSFVCVCVFLGAPSEISNGRETERGSEWLKDKIPNLESYKPFKQTRELNYSWLASYNNLFF